MTWIFNPADLKTVDLKDIAPGDIFYPLQAGSSCELWLRLAGEDSELAILCLAGEKAYQVWQLNPLSKFSVLRIAEGKNLRLEIQEKNGIGSFKYEPGELFIDEHGPHLVAQCKGDFGLMDPCYISLRTWEESARVNSNSKVSFSTWKLLDVSDPDNKKTLLSVGDWNDAPVIQP